MTTAAKDLHLTQSGVSQHIRTLEESLDIKLFDRVNKKIIPTAAGEKLYLVAAPAIEQIEEAVSNIRKKESSVQGKVRIGLPVEFGNSIIAPKLSQIGLEHPGIDFQLTLDFAPKLNELLLKRQLDFAFVDDFEHRGDLANEKIAEETLQLCCTEEYLAKHPNRENTKAYFESLEYISYQPEEPILRSWFQHHLHRRNLSLNVRACVMDAQGVSQFIVNHLGLGILPDHLLRKLRKRGHQIHVFEGRGVPLRNEISLAYVKNQTRPPVIEHVISTLKKLLFQI